MGGPSYAGIPARCHAHRSATGHETHRGVAAVQTRAPSSITATAQVAAQQVGKLIAEKAKAAGVEKVAFDRAGFAYHGRVKALADAAREAGLQF